MFYKVTADEYFEDCGYNNPLYDNMSEEERESFVDGIVREYEDILLPRRATKGSAGYDFFMPYDLVLEPNATAVVCSGIKWCPEVEGEGYSLYREFVLKLYPKSGLGFKYQLGLSNTIGIVDLDFAKDIRIKLVNKGDETIYLKKGQGFAQGIVEAAFFDPDYDEQFEYEERNGGFGSSKNSKGL